MRKVAIIGAGISGLVAALLLAAAGCQVTVYDAEPSPGGKLRVAELGGLLIDCGPTVLTLRPIFEAIFAQAGLTLADHLTLDPLDCLARHAWEDGAALDLFADTARNIDAIGDFAGAKAARGYAGFAQRSQRIFELLEAPFMQAPQPGLAGLMLAAGPKLAGISAFASLWSELGRYFDDPRLRQLFGRYATYCGASPFSAPAVLMLIAHAELRGVFAIQGGMFRLVQVLEARAQDFGARFVYSARVAEITLRGARASGIKLADGSLVAADHVIAAVDTLALEAGLFGCAARAALKGVSRGAKPSLSAVTWAIRGTLTGFPPAHHNVFFSNDYAAEFTALARGTLPGDPTVYLCAQDAGRFFVLVNAPAGLKPMVQEAEQCLQTMLEKLTACGAALNISDMEMTEPATFAQKFPATAGALYGRALTSWRDPFARPGANTKLPGLYLAGGSVHPGPGLPMAAISGRIAAACILQNR